METPRYGSFENHRHVRYGGVGSITCVASLCDQSADIARTTTLFILVSIGMIISAPSLIKVSPDAYQPSRHRTIMRRPSHHGIIVQASPTPNPFASGRTDHNPRITLSAITIGSSPVAGEPRNPSRKETTQ